jgi:hypothetical protein
MTTFELLEMLPTLTIKFGNIEFENAHPSFEMIGGAVWVFYITGRIKCVVYEGINCHEDLEVLIKAFANDMKNKNVFRVYSIWINGQKIEE